jgi:hypothetical protein
MTPTTAAELMIDRRGDVRTAGEMEAEADAEADEDDDETAEEVLVVRPDIDDEMLALAAERV